MFRKFLISVALMLFPMFGFAEASTITVTQQSPEFKITEPSNSTTGYQWRVDYDKSLLTLRSVKNYVQYSKLIGAGGKTIWVFRAKPNAFKKLPKQTQIHLIYERPWDKKDNPTELFFVVEFK
ncbi:MAG: protease inhibitor I42 family protein [Gammaproteobacteria bacterium]|nr:protease inhibitor I42 family protein [Gammaproteobacteria bacterium]